MKNEGEVLYELTKLGFLRLLAQDAGATVTTLQDNGVAIHSGAYVYVYLPKTEEHHLHLASEVTFSQPEEN